MSPENIFIGTRVKQIIYDLRFTIYDLEIMRSGAAGTAKQMRTHIRKAVIGRSYKGAGTPGGAYVRFTIWKFSAPAAREFCEAGASGMW